ncbi:MAG TPA: hypothetical protein VFW65_18275 [Pseudonocardiaceae bacterium]|nr:hypothetical protein [Pseudonocardiaceae bacterium]
MTIDYRDATPSHVDASASTLDELARVLSSQPAGPDSTTLYVRIGHVDHGGFLNLRLHNFSILRPSGGHNESADVAELSSPIHATEEQPFIEAIVINQPIEIQIESALKTLATLVARQDLIQSKHLQLSNVDQITRETDASSYSDVADSMRKHGWRQAARDVSMAAVRAKLPLKVSYQAPLLTADEVAERCPILRSVYNSSGKVRAAVDKTVALTTQGMIIRGDSSTEVMRYFVDLIDLASQRTYFAHLLRDASVCGNGYLQFGKVPDCEVVLLRPDDTAALSRGLGPRTVHLNGMQQIDSDIGISEIEPLVLNTIQRDVFQDTLQRMGPFASDKTIPAEHKAQAEALIAQATRAIDSIEKTFDEILGPVTTNLLSPPSGLYFPDFEMMSPAPKRLRISINNEGTRSATPT